MILSTDVHTETNCNIQGNTFSIKASPVAFDILSSKLYSNPTLAVVRELLTNAYDSQLAAGNPDKEIDVVFPTTLDNEFSIRDYGTGLSKEDVMSLYTTFFGSTKSDSNDFTGGFGLGSKTPFAYTSSFTVTSFYNGTKYVFLATKKDGYPSILPISEESTTEPNGLYIRIPTASNDTDFFKNAEDYLSLIPEIKVKANKTIVNNTPFITRYGVMLFNPVRVAAGYGWKKDTGTFIKQGQNTYRVDSYIYKHKHPNLSKFRSSLDIVYEVPIGTLAITPSREQLSNDGNNLAKLEDILVDFDKGLQKLLEDIFSNGLEGVLKITQEIPKCLIDAYEHALYQKYFSFMPNSDFRSYDLHYNDSDDICVSFRTFDYKLLQAKNNVAWPFIYNNRKYIFICAFKTNQKDFNKKIRKVMSDYAEELENVGIIVVDLAESASYHQKSILASMRHLLGYAWTLNNAPELNFDIEVVTLNKFLKKYPKRAVKRTRNPNPTPRIVNYQTVDVKYPHTCKNYSEYPKDIAKALGNQKCLVVLVDTKDTTVNNMAWQFQRFFSNSMLHLKNTKGEAFIRKFLESKYGAPMDYSQNYSIVITAKGNKNKFENYETITLDEIKEVLKQNKFWCTLPYVGNWLRHVRHFEATLKSFSEKEISIIDKYTVMRRHYLAAKYCSTESTSATNINVLSWHALNMLEDFGLTRSDIINASCDDKINKLINKQLAELYSFVYEHAKRSYHNNRITLKNRYKTDFFRILREGGTK